MRLIAMAAVTVVLGFVGSASALGDSPAFGVAAFDGQVTANPSGDPFTQAGGHPYDATTAIDFNTTTNPNPLIGDLWPVEPTKDVLVDLPPGFVVNPTIATTCTAAQLANSAGILARPLCPPTSQVGIVAIRSGGATFGPLPVFKLVPPPDRPAYLGFNVLGTVVTFGGEVRNGSDYGLSARFSNVSEGLAIAGSSLTLWGVPADASHDAERACSGQDAPWLGGPSCSSGAPLEAFLRNPTSCTPDGVGLPTTAHIDSWTHPGVFKDATFMSHVPPGYPAPPSGWGHEQGPTDCDQVPFNPTFTGAPVAAPRPGEAEGFSFDLSLPQNDDPGSVGEADLKKAVVTLPAGVRMSPASGEGLGGCSSAQVALHSVDDPTCPDSSKIGSVTIKTPLLDQDLIGSVYLATPHDNPFDSLIAIYLVVKGPGVTIKLPGKVETTGTTSDTNQLTATFDENPQLPFSNLHLEFKSGPRAPLALPRHCGTYVTHAELTSWSGKTVPVDSSFDITSDAATCDAANTFTPEFNAFSENSVARARTPFFLRLARDELEQEIHGLGVDTPTGLLAKIANSVICPELAASNGLCTSGSRVGNVTVGAGAGPNPLFIRNGQAFITDRYKGGRYGLSIVVPAVAGPFDLGNVVVRAAIHIDSDTAGLKVISDPLPTILDGIPLDVRDIRVLLDKPDFMVNPTNCAPKHVFGTVTSTEGAVAHVSTRFQTTDCELLPLMPKLSLTVGAPRHTQAGVSTPLTTVLTQPPGQANLRTVSVALPGTLNALLPVVNRACKLAEYHAGRCGDQAKVGTAVAVTPLLRDPLRGWVYFVKNPKRILPDLMIALRGGADIDVTGKISIPGGKRLATRFDTIPDAPITKFTLRLVSGRNGPLGVATNLCSARGRQATAAVGFRGQNGKLIKVNQRLHIAGCARASTARRGR